MGAGKLPEPKWASSSNLLLVSVNGTRGQGQGEGSEGLTNNTEFTEMSQMWKSQIRVYF